jgi:hypothetical protein
MTVVEVLLRAAPQAISIKDNSGKTPLDSALERVQTNFGITQLSASDPLITLLLKAGGGVGERVKKA